uniref:Coiled-coil domain-containing protein n=1 Tax=Syphacia muris TaxID=451379 RepID=A0A158R3Z4_9BILA
MYSEQNLLNEDDVKKCSTEESSTESTSTASSSAELFSSNKSDANNDCKKEDNSSTSSSCSSDSSSKNSLNQKDVILKPQVSWQKIDHRTSFEVWLKNKKAAELKRKQLLLKKKTAEKQRMEQRKAEAQKCYEAWKKNADNLARQKLREERKKQSERKAKEAELKQERLENNKKAFEEWKRKHPETNPVNNDIGFELLERSKSTNALNDRIQSASKVYQQWCKEKNADIARKNRLEAIEKQVKEMQISNEKEYRKALANDAFNLWLDIKNKQRCYESSLPGRIMRYEREMKYVQRPWRTPSRPCTSVKATANGAQKRCCRKQVKTADRARRAKSVF